MPYFPEEIDYPNGSKIKIDKDRLLLGLKIPYTLNAITSKLQSTPFSLETSTNPKEQINNTSTRFWIQKREYTLDELGILRNKFGQDLDWIGPVYDQSGVSVSGQKDSICPLPNVLIITLTAQASGSEPLISQSLYTKYKMKRSSKKSNYSGLNTHYYVIEDTSSFNAYKVKDDLEPDTATFKSFRFEHMPLIIPILNIPNDTNFSTQWNMLRIKAGGNGTTAWDLSIGNENVVVCVIDSGCELDHPDLRFASPGINLDTMSGDGSPVEPPGPTEIGHGTAVAGIIAATINNSLGVAGVAGNCKILPLAFVNWTEEELLRAINFAILFKVKVINMSIYFTLPDTTAVEDALQIASVTALICAASGNTNNSFINWPASSQHVMACGASDQNDNRQSPTSPISWGVGMPGSNFGPEMSVVAPGINIPSTDMKGAAGFDPSDDFLSSFIGTSAAVPHLSGLAALVFSEYPDASPAEVRNIIERTADKVGTLPYVPDPAHSHGIWNVEMGYGRINALRAVLAAAAFNPFCPWFREVLLEGKMILHDYENIGDDEEKTSIFSASGIPTSFQLGPFQTHVDLPVWIDKVGGEVRGEVRLALDWRNDSSVDVKFNIKLYEGTSEDTDDLDGELINKTVNVPRDTTGFINETVLNTDEGDNDFIKLEMSIKNNRRL